MECWGRALLLLLLLRQGAATLDDVDRSALQQLDAEYRRSNARAAALTWRLAVDPDAVPAELVARVAEQRTAWRNAWCARDVAPGSRQMYLLCRGPKYTPHQASELNALLGRLQRLYSDARVCRGPVCYRGEPDLERLMARSRDPAELLWGWVAWRQAVGPPARPLYPAVVGLMNQGARSNGYPDAGAAWREELETPGLELVAERLYARAAPLYRLLHAVVRHRLGLLHGAEVVPPRGPIPAHLLGNMWAQDWGALLDLLLPGRAPSLTAALRLRNYTATDMVRRAEDFYTSLGLEPMTPSFWKHSQIERPRNSSGTCHGTAANMFRPGDFRMLLCAEVNEEDFYVIHHEMGHIEYYMAYRHQPVLFQEGANSAFQEAVGDAITYGVMAPQHLQRLGLSNGTEQDDGDLVLLLRRALSKLPQLPFGLLVDKWRWSVFRGDTPPQQYNSAWWELKRHYQGVVPPVARMEDDFDPAAKFHIADNTPYIRYFLSDILQVQMFKALCEATVFGHVGTGHALPMPLHRCDIYGSKQAGQKLRAMMSLGSSQPWDKALQTLTGRSYYDVEPLLEYYAPVHRWLLEQVRQHNIPVGWED